MGLDSVELVMSFEKFFNIKIPDKEAECMVTIQDAAKGISQYLVFQLPERNLPEELRKQIKIVFQEKGNADSELLTDDPVGKYLQVPVSKADAQKFESFTGLKCPPLRDEKETRKLWLGIPASKKSARILTISDFIDFTAAFNYKTLVNPEQISSFYEVLSVVKGITSDQLGVDFEDIYNNSSFTNDLGID